MYITLADPSACCTYIRDKAHDKCLYCKSSYLYKLVQALVQACMLVTMQDLYDAFEPLTRS